LEESVITFNDVLRAAGVDPREVQLARHQDQRVTRQSIYAAWKSPGGQEKLEAYQAVQASKRFDVGGFVATFDAGRQRLAHGRHRRSRGYLLHRHRDHLTAA
jgi:hypothetical protein